MKKIKFFVFSALAIASSLSAMAGTLSGTVVDSSTNMPLIGATVMVAGTTQGTITDIDGNFKLDLDRKPHTLSISYVSYTSKELPVEAKGKVEGLVIALDADAQLMDAVKVSAKANKESENALQNERIASNVAIENMGAKEMSLKGLSNAEDGVKKMTGISIADAGELFVRGLGDRYSLTTMNGVPVASPNPDNKLIPLDVFPSSAIQNITVSKVYRVDAFADYSGALIDIATKDMVSENFFNISLSVGANTATTGGKFLTSDRASLFTTPKLPSEIDGIKTGEYEDYMINTQENPFGTGFSATESSALPDLGAQIGFGRNWEFDYDHKLDLLLSLSVDNSREKINDGTIMTINANGNIIDDFVYDSYDTNLDISALGSLGYEFGSNRLNYTAFYARNVEDSFKSRVGLSEEGDDIISNNAVQHIYSLLNNQLSGDHDLSDKLLLSWVGAYSLTSSDEPDRRQIIFYKDQNADGTYKLHKLDEQATNRYFGSLSEDEWSGNLSLRYRFSDQGKVKFGGAYRAKDRDYLSSMYTYKYKNGGPNGTHNPFFDSIFDTDDHINQGYFNDESIGAGIYNPASSDYFATSDVGAVYINADYTFGSLLVDLGVRFENSKQWVKSWTDTAPLDDPTYSTLNKSDFFPALNLKYALNDEQTMRFSASKSVTRPSFVEMAPFKYRESYSVSYVRGNGDLQNGYNYNFDLRYDFFKDKGSDMLSACAYYKFLDNPIERVQKQEGASTVYTFMNSDSGYAAGFELEFRKELIKDLRLGVNGSYILTQVVLEEGGGIYTDAQRQLQGASPYLVNADLSYTLRSKDESSLTMTLLYSLQGRRIDAVGIFGLKNVMQEELQELNFVANYAVNSKFSVSLKMENLLNHPTVFTQEAKNGRVYEVGRYTTGIDASIGVSYKF